MTGAEALLRTLTANGVDVCFMNPGTSEMHFVAALDTVGGMRGVLCLFEGVCSGAADGYARMTGRPASTLLHLGPGLGNALANFHNARKAFSPVVNIVGEHSTQHLLHDAPLTADIEAFARTVGSDVFYARQAEEVGELTARAIEAAVRPPGQVSTLIVPADFSWSEAGSPGNVLGPPVRRIPTIPSGLRLDSRTGLVLSGSALLEPGLEAAGRLAARTGVRVFANRNTGRTDSGRGRFQPQRIAYFPEPAEAQMAGLTQLLLIESKVPVSFFGYPGRRSLLSPEDCEVITLAAPGEDGIAVLRELAGDSGDAFHAPACELRKPDDEALTADAIGRTLTMRLPDHAIVSDEMISAAESVWPWLLKARPHAHLPVTGGSIGQCLPVALGAAVACPDRKVVALEADGSAMYTLQSLWTMAREGLDVTTVIFANRRYRILDIEMRRTGAEGFGPRANDMIDIARPDLDFVKLSEGMGVEASRAITAREFFEQFESAMRTRGPRLIEAALST